MKYLLIAFSLTLASPTSAEDLSAQEDAYNCLADQAYYPDAFRDALELIEECNSTMEDYLEIYYDEIQPLEEDYDYEN